MGYVARDIDGSDKRAKEIRLTQRGIDLATVQGSRTKKIYQQTNKWSTLTSSWINCPKKAMNLVDHLRQLVQEDAKVLHFRQHHSGTYRLGAQFRRSRANIEVNRTAGGRCP